MAAAGVVGAAQQRERIKLRLRISQPEKRCREQELENVSSQCPLTLHVSLNFAGKLHQENIEFYIHINIYKSNYQLINIVNY